MGHIRINDLARELSCKSKRILAALPFAGITDGKNHSSSLSQQQADRIRAYLHGRGGQAKPPEIESDRPDTPPVLRVPNPQAEDLLTRVPEIRPTRVAPRSMTSQSIEHHKHRIAICPRCNAAVRDDKLQRHLANRCPSRRKTALDAASKSRKRVTKKRSKLRRGKRRKAKRGSKAKPSGWVSFVSGGRPGSNRRH